MNRKKRIMICSVAMGLLALGILCLVMAVVLQGKMKGTYVGIIGFSSFGFVGLSLFVMLKNFSAMLSSEMTEKAEKLQEETNFFSKLYMEETPQTLEARFIQAGFKPWKGYLHKKQFSFVKDFINHCVVIANEQNIIEYFDAFVKEVEKLTKRKRRTRLQSCYIIYLFFFNHAATQEELDFLKNVMIGQDVMQDFPNISDTIVPIVYDTTDQMYIVRAPKRKASVKLLQIALRKFYKIIGQSNVEVRGRS